MLDVVEHGMQQEHHPSDYVHCREFGLAFSGELLHLLIEPRFLIADGSNGDEIHQRYETPEFFRVIISPAPFLVFVDLTPSLAVHGLGHGQQDAQAAARDKIHDVIFVKATSLSPKGLGRPRRVVVHDE